MNKKGCPLPSIIHIFLTFNEFIIKNIRICFWALNILQRDNDCKQRSYWSGQVYKLTVVYLLHN